MTAISELAERVASIELQDLPDAVAEAARQRLFDTAATFVIGAASPEGQLLQAMGEERIRYMCGATRSTEIDDIHIGSCTTVGSIVVPVALLGNADDQTVLCSLVAGYQAMTSLGKAVDGAHCVYEGIWPTYLTAPFAAAAVTARIFNLDTQKTAHALAIAATRCVGMTGQMRGPQTSRWYTVGCAAAEGSRAARAARLGVLGDLGVLETSFGRATGTTFDPSAFDARQWTILDIDTKPFRVGRQALSAVQAYQTLAAAGPTSHVRVWLPKQVIGLVQRAGMHHQLGVEQVTLADDPRLSDLYPEHWGARVAVTRPDGSTDGCEVLDPRGSAQAGGCGWPDLLAKHRTLGAGEWLDALYAVCREFGEGSHSADVLRLIGAS